MIRAVLLAALLSSCAQMARFSCESIYCTDVEPVESCRYYNDVVIICIEDQMDQNWNILKWAGNMSLGLVKLAASAL